MLKSFLTILFLAGIIILSIFESILWIVKPGEFIYPYILNFIIFIFAILIFVLLVNKKEKHTEESRIIVSKENDTVLITKKAMVHLIENSIINEEISEAHVNIMYSKLKEVSIEVIISIKIGSNIIEVVDAVRHQITQLYKKSIGQNLSDVKVIVGEFVNIK